MNRVLRAGCAALAVLVAASAARAADQQAVNQAVSDGVRFLHGEGAMNGLPGGQSAGAAALLGLTLLECDAKPDDPVVRQAIETVRKAGVRMRDTYSLALSIFFLDRLGDPADEPLIQSMGVRLMGGQCGDGGWSYTCSDVSDSEVRRLTNIGQHPDQEKPKDPGAKPGKLTVKDLPKEIQDQIASLNSLPPAPGGGDNSNTQFALLGLWVARRHGLPVDPALIRVDRHFRTTQADDGGWRYTSDPGGSTDPNAVGGSISGGTTTGSMTCAGVLALTVARGPKAEAAAANGKPTDLSNDAGLKKGLAALGMVVGAPAPKEVGGKSFYFLWSLERVGVILDQDKIGGHDWYDWGADILVNCQRPDGSWKGEYAPGVETCFALLFLKKANVARDLTSLLKGKTDLGAVTLKSNPGGDPPPDKPKPDEGLVTPVKPPAGETEGARMARELAQASADRRDELLQQYKEGKGVVYTEALAGAIAQLGGEDKRKAREALAERLTRMKAEVLSRYFQDGDGEIRRAAALASAADAAVSHAAHAALRDLSGEQLGATEAEWKAWWKNRDK